MVILIIKHKSQTKWAKGSIFFTRHKGRVCGGEICWLNNKFYKLWMLVDLGVTQATYHRIESRFS